MLLKVGHLLDVQVQRVTGICPGVAIHIPWDSEDDWYAVKEYAGQLGLRIGAVNPNLFQDDTYRLGSLCHFDKAVRQQAIEHVLECVQIAQSVDSRVISLWLADGINYPGQDDLRRRRHRLLESLQAIYVALPADMRLLIEYKFFEPSFYSTDLPDWGTSLLMAQKLGPQAEVLVDSGHHPQGTNIAQIVAQLLDEGRLGNPFQYRDHRTDGVMEQVLARVPREVLYQRTGIQLQPFNTLFQLYAHELLQPGDLAHAHRLLLIPDLLHSWLCGSQTSERTNATTTQCWDSNAGGWVTDLLDRLGIPTAMLPSVVEAGTELGTVLPEWRSDLGTARVVAPATHDTGSAIAATPVQLSGGWGYISSGTWSLVGVELLRPIMTAEALAANFTNEGGVFGTTRFLKNVMGLWLLKELYRRLSHHTT